MLTACTVGPSYHKPDIKPPDAWRTDITQPPGDAGASPAAANGAAAPAASRPIPPAGPAGAAPSANAGGPPQALQPNTSPAVTAPYAQWWRGFNSAPLNDLIAQALKANDDLAAAVARVQEADAQLRISGAALFPSLSVSGTGTRERVKQQNIVVSSAGGTPTVGTTVQPVTGNQFGVQANASYELDFWGKNLATRRSAYYLAQASRYDRATVELTVMTTVAVTYFQAMELHDRVSVTEQDLETARKILDGLRLQASVGIANALDVAQEETTVAVLSASIPPLEQQFRQSVNALAILVGKLPQELQFPGGKLTDLLEPQVQPGLPSQLLARRPDVAAAEAQLVSANADIAAARAAFFPSIDLTADGGFQSAALSNLFTPANRLFAITGQLVQQIFTGGALTGKYRLTKARYSELLADYHKSVLSAFGDAENALIALQQTAEQYRRQEAAVASARRAYEFSETQMRAGTVNVLTVLNTQSALFNAEDTLVQVRFAHLQALVQLFSALGGGWQKV
ncbi:MAG TPA: efflux transporter outer membrane subunit [Steroidobacteraceae bacterium]